MINFIRNFLGEIIVIIDKIFSPKVLKRSDENQAQVDEETKKLTLYQFRLCPFCVKVRRIMKHLNLNIELRDVNITKEYETELIEGGGKRKVPCLRIEDNTGSFQWMYESNDINKYLSEHFAVN